MTTTPDRIVLGPDEAAPEGYCVIDRPVRFEGTPEARRYNYGTHYWQSYGDPEDGEVYCDGCGSKPWHAAADYPCGTEPPRERFAVKVEA